MGPDPTSHNREYNALPEGGDEEADGAGKGEAPVRAGPGGVHAVEEPDFARAGASREAEADEPVVFCFGRRCHLIYL